MSISKKAEPTATALPTSTPAHECIRVKEYESPPHQHALPHVAQHRISLMVRGDGGVVRQRRNGILFEGSRQPGDIDIIPALSRGHCHSHAHAHIVEVQLPTALLNRVGHEVLGEDRPFSLSTQFAMRDDKLRNLILMLHDETEHHSKNTVPLGSNLMTDSLTTALILHLLRQSAHITQHTFTKEPTCDWCGGLSAKAQQQVLAYVQDNLSGSICLEGAAKIVGLSRYYFLRAFKASFGTTPHQYVIEQRVQLAKTLMAQKHLTLSDIARRSGFNDQSHFTRHFRRLTGTTPKAWSDLLSK